MCDDQLRRESIERIGRRRRAYGLAIVLLSQTAVAQVDITGGSPAGVPNLSGVPPLQPFGAQSDTREQLVLEIVINGTSLGEPSDFELRHGQLYAEPRTLDNAGIRVNDLKADSDGWLALSSIPGLRATYSAARQQAILDVESTRQTTRRIGYTQPSTPKATPGTGFLLNYDVSYTRQFGDDRADDLGIWSEQRFFSPFGVFDNTGTWVNNGGTSSRYTRLDTNWSYSDPAKLFTTTVGDSVSGSLPWTRSVRFAGVQVQRDFSLRPDLITFPLPTFAASAAVPSAVDLYINGLRQYSGEVAPGPFQIAQPPSLTGAGVAQVVVTDALGRRVTTSVPLYIDARLLSKGWSSYSFEAGFLRDNYTLDSFSYEHSPVYNGVFSYGATDWLTLQAHSEGGQGLANGGGGAVFSTGGFGVFSTALAASRIGGMTGTLYSLGYQYIGPKYSVNLQGTQASSGYRDVAALSGTSTFQHVYQATASVSFLHAQSATISYVDSEDSFSGHARVVTLAWNAQFGRRWSIFATTYRDFLQKNVWGGSIGVTLALGGNMAVSTTLAQSGGHTTTDVTASRPADFGGGWGWSVQAGAGAGADYRHAFAGADYRTSFGEFQATAQQFNGTTTGTAELTGAIAIMDRAVLPTRTVTDGFALVSTDGVAGVPVSLENRKVGMTNSGGYLLVPDLQSYQRNQVAIDSLALPADARIDTTRLYIAPERRAGALAHFAVSRYQGASVSFVDANNTPIKAGAAATNQGTGETVIVGFDGIAFFGKLDATNTVTIKGPGLNCAASVPFDPPSSHDLPQIGPFICQGKEARDGETKGE